MSTPSPPGPSQNVYPLPPSGPGQNVYPPPPLDQVRMSTPPPLWTKSQCLPRPPPLDQVRMSTPSPPTTRRPGGTHPTGMHSCFDNFQYFCYPASISQKMWSNKYELNVKRIGQSFEDLRRGQDIYYFKRYGTQCNTHAYDFQLTWPKDCAADCCPVHNPVKLITL